MDDKNIIGIIAILIGIIAIVCPITSQMVLSIIPGLFFILFACFCFMYCSYFWGVSKASSISYFIIGFLSIFCACVVTFNVAMFDFLVSLNFYILGFLLIIAGLYGIFAKELRLNRVSSLILAIIGILICLFGYLAMLSPLFVGILIGLGLIIDGSLLIVSSNN